MREILFRGKRTDNGEWFEGCLATFKDGDCAIFDPDDEEAPLYQADPETVGQYIGLTDKNGKKIFENDIISTSKYGVDNGKGQNYSGKDNFVVGYADGTYYLENHLRRFSLRPDIGAEIIGNIYDNPELLK